MNHMEINLIEAYATFHLIARGCAVIGAGFNRERMPWHGLAIIKAYLIGKSLRFDPKSTKWN